MSSSRLQEVKNNRNHNCQAQKVVAVAYRRWPFTRGSSCKALTGKLFSVLAGWSLMRGGRLWRFDYVHINHVPRDYNPFGLGLTNLAANN